MDKQGKKDRRPDADLECRACGPKGKALVGEEEQRRLSPAGMKCRKCENDFWENAAKGLLQANLNDFSATDIN